VDIVAALLQHNIQWTTKALEERIDYEKYRMPLWAIQNLVEIGHDMLKKTQNFNLMDALEKTEKRFSSPV
jgi:hypothetical protein